MHCGFSALKSAACTPAILENAKTVRTSELSKKISNRLLYDIVSGTLPAGQHISAQQVTDSYGASRTPLREAFDALEASAVLIRQPNRGNFVAETLPEGATEQFLRQLYDWTKAKFSDVFVRAAREGWAEREEGYGWRFLPVASTPETVDEIYRFRMVIEPAAMLERAFQLDRKVLDQQRRI